MDALTNRGTSGPLLLVLLAAIVVCARPAGAAPPPGLDPYPFAARLDARRAAERARAARVLGYLGTERQVPALADVLMRDRSRDARLAAAVSLGQIGGPAAASALSVQLLGVLHSPEPIPTTEPGWDFLSALVSAVGLTGSPDALPALQACLESPEPRLRALAVDALAALATPDSLALIAGALRDPDATCRQRAALGLGWHATAAQVPALLAALQAATEDASAGDLAVALARIPDPSVVPALIAAADHPLPIVRLRVAALLGSLAGREAAPTLERLCADPAAMVHLAALPALAWIGPDRALPLLAPALQSTAAPTLQGACKAAAIVDDASVVADLTRVALCQDLITASAATRALCALSASEATSQALIQPATEGVPDASSAARHALVTRTDPVAAQYALTLLLSVPERNAPHPWLNFAVPWSLAASDLQLARCVAVTLSDTGDAWGRALHLLAIAGDDEALDALTQAADESPDPATSALIARALADCPRADATPLLLSLLGNGLPPTDLSAMLESVARRDPQCLAYVAALAITTTTAPDLRKAAHRAVARALAERGLPTAVVDPDNLNPPAAGVGDAQRTGPDAFALAEPLLHWAQSFDDTVDWATVLAALPGTPEGLRPLRQVLGLDVAWGPGEAKPQRPADAATAVLGLIAGNRVAAATPVVREFLARVAQWRMADGTWKAQGWGTEVVGAIEAAGRLRDAESVPLLTEALGDSAADVREAALQALAETDPAAAAPLVARAARVLAAPEVVEAPLPAPPPTATVDEARRALRRAIALDYPRLRELAASAARLCDQAGRPADALPLWLQACAATDDPADLDALAACYQALDMPSQAARATRRAAWVRNW